MLFAPWNALAINKLDIQAEQIQGKDWQANGVQLQINLDDSAQISIKTLALPPPIGTISDLAIHCKNLNTTAKQIDCPNGTGKLTSLATEAQTFPLSFRYRAGSGALDLKLDALPTTAGALNLTTQYSNAGWQLAASGEHLSLSALTTLGSAWLDILENTSIEGHGDLQINLTGTGNQIQTSDIQTSLQAKALDALQSRLAAEGLVADIQIRSIATENNLQNQIKIHGKQGQFYADPVLVDFSTHPATVDLQLTQNSAGISLLGAEVRQPNAISASMAGDIQLSPVINAKSAELQIDSLQFPAAYALLQPFLIGTAADSLETLGLVSGDLSVSQNRPSRLNLKVSGLHIDDLERRFAFYDTYGEIHWSASEIAKPSTLTWDGGRLYKLDLAGSQARFRTGNGRFILLDPLSQPVLDGALNIREFDASNIGEQSLRFKFNADVAPINLTKLTRALGWPEFGGELSGDLPALEYANKQLVLSGALQAKMFDGDVSVDNLRIQDPLGGLPRLQANITARNLDLEQATDAFSFGRIQGRLNADVKALRLLRWQPIAFDAQLYTPPASLLGTRLGSKTAVYQGEALLNDKPHRISQRAIENISDIGGSGAAGVLSRGFLGFFEDFAYDQISLACRLKNGVCQMQGLQPKGDGYYIVKGRLLPRIDVIGFAREVSWPSLVAQLKQISESEGPVVGGAEEAPP